MITEKGYIGQFTYSNEDTGYYVFELVTNSSKLICVGNARGYGLGESIEVDGDYYNHPIYGRQLKIKAIRAIEPDSPLAIERYLGSGAIKGVGESLAKRIVKEFGEDTFRIAQEEPEKLSKVKGISLKKAYDIGNQIAEKRDVRDAMIFMQQHGISQNLSNKIYNKYGVKIYEIIKENPYKLVEDIKGVGFKIADEIAAKSGFKIDSDYRVRCGILHCLTEISYDGHTYYPKKMLLDKVIELLKVQAETIEAQLSNLWMERKIIIKNLNQEEIVYQASYYYEELKCAKKLLELKNSYINNAELSNAELSNAELSNTELSNTELSNTELSNTELFNTDKSIENKINILVEKMDITLDELQKEAVVKCAKSGVFVLSGGPGTGKTTTINTIIKYFIDEKIDFLLAAPTGRAAKRMSETTGYEASTIHRLLENSGAPEDDELSFFNRNADNPLEADAIIIDEMSMVDIHLMRALLEATLPGTKLVLVGDVDQLSSVGPGEVLKDILESGIFESVRLEKIFRQDADSHIISNAYKINHGENIDFTEKNIDFFLIEKDDPLIIYQYIDALVRNKIPKQFNIGIFDTQILTPMRKGNLGVINLNQILQKRLNPPMENKKEYLYGDTIFRTGDKVMQIKNNYNLEWELIGDYNVCIESGLGVYNGDVGTIENIDLYMKNLTVLFDDGRKALYQFEQLDEIELAYAITIHKSQGSEYPVIIIPLLTGPKMLLTRNLLYTAVTRAQQCVILIGSKETFTEMIHTDSVYFRYSSLKERIIELNNAD